MPDDALAVLTTRGLRQGDAEARLRKLQAGTLLSAGRGLRGLLQRRFKLQGRGAARDEARSGGRLRSQASRGRGGRSAELVPSLRIALSGGGCETALRYAEELAGSGLRLDVDALDLITRAFGAAGRHREACALWERHAPSGARSHPSWLTLRAITGEPGFSWHTLTASHPFLVDQGIQGGHLDREQVAALLLERPLSSLLHPEQHLLHFNAARASGDGDATALRHYFATHASIFEFRGFQVGMEAAAALRSVNGAARTGPLVSVAMSARNARPTILMAITSLLAQTHRNLEILVCDDASDDDTLTVLREAFEHDPRVRLFRSEGCQGTYNVRNQLFAEARGELLTTHDADDFALPTRIADQVRALERTRADACFGSWLRLRPDGSVVFFWDQRALRLSVVSLMMRREVSDRLGPYRSARYGADLEQLEKVRRGPFRVARVTRPLMLSLWGQGSLTRAAASEALENGYRSAGRRAYSEVVFQRHLLGDAAVPETAVIDLLEHHDNYCEATGLVEVTSRSCLRVLR